jgi:thiamine-phosphate pyrophosphorylase
VKPGRFNVKSDPCHRHLDHSKPGHRELRTVLLYYITDRRQFAGDERQRRKLLLAKISEAARSGVDYIQLREKDLSARDLLPLAKEAAAAVHALSEQSNHRSRLLVNSRVDVALAAGADGVHLTSNDILASDARAAWSVAAAYNSSLATLAPVVGVSCHTADEVRFAEGRGADFAVFGPVFEKLAANIAGVGLEALRAACAGAAIPVFALGGVSLENAAKCIRAGAAGIAGIRLFQNNDVATVLATLRK